MNESIEKLRLAGDLLQEGRAGEPESRSLALSLSALRRRRNRQRRVRWAIPAAIAATLVVAALLVRSPVPQAVVQEETPLPSLVVRTRPLPEGVAVHSRPAAEVRISSGTFPADRIARTAVADGAPVVVNSRLSSRVEFLNDRQLLAALDGRPIMLAETSDGDRRLVFLDERDQHLLWQP